MEQHFKKKKNHWFEQFQNVFWPLLGHLCGPFTVRIFKNIEFCKGHEHEHDFYPVQQFIVTLMAKAIPSLIQISIPISNPQT